MDQQEINEIIAKHQLWLEGKEDGVRANFINENLRGKDFSGKDLRKINFNNAKLEGANFTNADLSEADFTDAELSEADFTNADLKGAILRRANFMDANLNGTDIRGADLRGTNFINANIITINLPFWDAFIYTETVRIGCQHHSHEKWMNFSDEEIQDMHPSALRWWKKHKLLILAAIDVIKARVAEKNTIHKDEEILPTREINEIIKEHQMQLKDEEGKVQLDFRNANLCSANITD